MRSYFLFNPEPGLHSLENRPDPDGFEPDSVDVDPKPAGLTLLPLYGICHDGNSVWAEFELEFSFSQHEVAIGANHGD